jgi:hypothetical protein
MLRTWQEALETYCYPVDLTRYEKAKHFPCFFKKNITGDGRTTVAFEDYFRKLAPTKIEVWYEVLFWKLYSRKGSWGKVTQVVEHTRNNLASSMDLWKAVQEFIRKPGKSGLQKLREPLGFKYGMAVPLTFVAFADPHSYPMIDRKVARWVNENLQKHSAGLNTKLTRFKSADWKNTYYIHDSDFDAYLNWVAWCREVAPILSNASPYQWRARDVEMAVWVAYDKKLNLSVLP